MQQANLQEDSHRFDGVHVRNRSLGLMAINVKTILNPLLGLNPYEQRASHHPSNRTEQRDRTDQRDKTEQQDNYNQRQRNQHQPRGQPSQQRERWYQERERATDQQRRETPRNQRESESETRSKGHYHHNDRAREQQLGGLQRRHRNQQREHRWDWEPRIEHTEFGYSSTQQNQHGNAQSQTPWSQRNTRHLFNQYTEQTPREVGSVLQPTNRVQPDGPQTAVKNKNTEPDRHTTGLNDALTLLANVILRNIAG